MAPLEIRKERLPVEYGFECFCDRCTLESKFLEDEEDSGNDGEESGDEGGAASLEERGDEAMKKGAVVSGGGASSKRPASDGTSDQGDEPEEIPDDEETQWFAMQLFVAK
jgi:hypothetical protein